ncbi:MAG: neuromedin U [Planctomycetota bacterium]
MNNVLNIQPVYPFALNESVNVITRTIIPVVYQPELVPGTGSESGLGDTSFTALFSPRAAESVIWGLGPVLLLPTSTSDRLGAGEWGLGASAVVVTMPHPWVIGGLVNNVWSFEGGVNSMLFQPFVNYNMKHGWYLTSSPTVTADWEATGGEQWTVPLGGGVGKVTRIGKQPVNLQVQAFYNVEHPTVGPDWSIRFQIAFLFPK